LLLGGREEAGKTNTAHTCTHEERGRESKGEAKGKGGGGEEEVAVFGVKGEGGVRRKDGIH
jgi:hypothetical protein